MRPSPLRAQLRWLVCLGFIACCGLVVLTGGCPNPPPPDTNGNGDNGGTDGGGTDGGGTDGGGTDGGGTDGGGTDGGGTDGGGTDGGGTDGGGTDGGGTDGGGTDGGGTDGGGTDGGGTDGGGSDGGGTTPTPEPTSINLALIAAAGDAVPGQTGATFTEFGKPIIDSAGRIAFWALYTGGVGRGGLYVWNGTALVEVLRDDPATAGIVPSRDTPHYFGDFVRTSSFEPLDQGVAWGDGGRLLFVSRVSRGSGGRVDGGIYRWRASDGNFARVVDGTLLKQVFDPQPSVIDPDFFAPGITDSGMAFFGAEYFGFISGGSTLSGEGVFISNGTALTVVADTNVGKTVPDQPSIAQFVSLEMPTTLSPVGDYLFQGSYVGGNGTRGLYLRNGGTNYRALDNRPDGDWNGLPLGTRINASGTVYRTGVGPNRHIVVQTTITLPGQSQRAAVLLWRPSTLAWYELGSEEGIASTALLSSVNEDGKAVVVANSHPHIDDGDMSTRLDATLPAALQSASLAWAATGGAINNHGRALVPYQHTTGGKGLLFWTGSQLLIVADAQFDVPIPLSDLTPIPDTDRDRPGRSGMLNDSDQGTFRAVTQAGVEGIYRFKAE